MTKPIPGNYIFNALKDHKCIVMACNTRIIKGVTKGILRAAKDIDAAVIIEIARSESDLKGGYIGLTPKQFAEMTIKIADEVGYDIWALHADHIGIKKGTPEDIKETKKLIKSQIGAGFTSFAIDVSHLFNFEGKTVEEELEPNIKATVEIGNFIMENMKGKDFGLEAEVGEIGRKNEEGMILTTAEEAIAFIKALNKEGINPQVLAIANGSTHGNIYDKEGRQIKQVSINIGRTVEIAKALRDNNFDVRIAQHGITGTPRELIYEKFPHGDVIKGNVGTFWQNIVYDVLKETNPDLVKEIHDWVHNTFKEEAAKAGIKTDEQLFGKFGKKATKQFFDKIYGIDKETEKKIEEKAYKEAIEFFKAFKSEGTAKIVRGYMKKEGKIK